MSERLAVGDRVRLKPNENWLSIWYPLAKHKRLGTVISESSHGCWSIRFDVKRPGAKHKVGDFHHRDIVFVSRGDLPSTEPQPGLL